jgi:hypothetical protein
MSEGIPRREVLNAALASPIIAAASALLPSQSPGSNQLVQKGLARTHGEAVYGTTASPFPTQVSFGRATSKPGRVYLEIFDWPMDCTCMGPGGEKGLPVGRPQEFEVQPDERRFDDTGPGESQRSHRHGDCT